MIEMTEMKIAYIMQKERDAEFSFSFNIHICDKYAPFLV